MTTAIEFYKNCEANKNTAIVLAAGNQQLIEKIKADKLPLAQHFETESGFLPAPGFTAEAIFNRAKSDIQYTNAMNRTQKELDSKFDF